MIFKVDIFNFKSKKNGFPIDNDAGFVGGVSGGEQLRVYGRRGLPGVFIDHQLLRPAVRHGVHLLPHLPGGGSPVALAAAGHKAGVQRQRRG